MNDFKTNVELAMEDAHSKASHDFKKGLSCDSERHDAMSGSAWDAWYSQRYMEEIKSDTV